MRSVIARDFHSRRFGQNIWTASSQPGMSHCSQQCRLNFRQFSSRLNRLTTPCGGADLFVGAPSQEASNSALCFPLLLAAAGTGDIQPGLQQDRRLQGLSAAQAWFELSWLGANSRAAFKVQTGIVTTFLPVPKLSPHAKVPRSWELTELH